MPRPAGSIPENEVKKQILTYLQCYGVEIGDISELIGPVEKATRDSLVKVTDADPCLVATAIRLSNMMDSRPSASVAKELVATKLAIMKTSGEKEKTEKEAFADIVNALNEE